MDSALTARRICFNPSIRPRRPAWASASRSAERSSRTMVAGCGPRPMRPAARNFASRCPPALPRIRPMSQRGRVYVIDDDPAMRDSLDFLLGTAGLSVRLFDSAQIFLNELPGLEFGCVVTDIRMPGIDGIELLRQLESGPSATRLPVIVMTG